MRPNSLHFYSFSRLFSRIGYCIFIIYEYDTLFRHISIGYFFNIFINFDVPEKLEKKVCIIIFSSLIRMRAKLYFSIAYSHIFFTDSLFLGLRIWPPTLTFLQNWFQDLKLIIFKFF
jgi:hypothetical protein